MFDESKFIAEIKALANKSRKAQQARSNESATIHLVILPFIKALGYDIFNDEEVAPEYVADVGTKHGEKVDYALKIDGQPVVIIEAKSTSASLGSAQHSQLYRYYSTLQKVKLAILTNGKEACFYSDLEYTNVMDNEPFLKLDFQGNNDDNFDFLKSIHRYNFSVDNIIAHAKSKKYYNEVKDFLQQNLSNPNEDFVYFVGKAVKDGQRPRKHELPSFESAIKKAFHEISKSEESTTALKSNLSSSSPTIQPFKNQVSAERTSKPKRKEQKPAAWHEARKEYWTKFKSYLEGHNKLEIKSITDWSDQRCSSWKEPDCVLYAYANDKSIAVAIVLGRNGETVNGRIRDALYGNKEFIESKIGQNIRWKENKGNRVTIILNEVADIYTKDQYLLEQQFRWLKENLELFHNVFYPITRDIES